MNSFDYYIFITPDNTIWGVGTSKKETVLDAIKNINDYSEWDDRPTRGKLIRATYELAWEIWDNGFNEDMWDIEKNGEMWLATLKDHNSDNYKKLSMKETKLRYD